MKVNQAGVIPVIFSLSLLQFPLTLTYFFPRSSFSDFISTWLSPSGDPGVWIYGAFNILLIIFFTYFYSTISFNPVEVSKNIQQNGGFVPGIRPGKPTSDYLSRISKRLTLFGALFLAVLATLPSLFTGSMGLGQFAPTSVMIAVSVALETSKQLENQLLMRHYKGFLK